MLANDASLFKEGKGASVAQLTVVRSTFLSYVEAYHTATISLFDQALNRSNSYDLTFQAIPIMSLVRHSVELMLKTIIHGVDDSLGTDDMKRNTHHDIKKLWVAAQRAVENLGIQPEKSQLPIVTGIILELSKRDQFSFSFRYPFDKTLEVSSLGNINNIDLANAREVYSQLRDFMMNLVVEVFHQPTYRDL
jgi:hypothetical protein